MKFKAMLLIASLLLPNHAPDLKEKTAPPIKPSKPDDFSDVERAVSTALSFIAKEEGCSFNKPTYPKVVFTTNLMKGAGGMYNSQTNTIYVPPHPHKEVMYHEFTHAAFKAQSWGQFCAYKVLAGVVEKRASLLGLGPLPDEMAAMENITSLRRAILISKHAAILASRSMAVTGAFDPCQLQDDADGEALLQAQGVDVEYAHTLRDASFFIYARSDLNQGCVNEMMAYSLGEYLALKDRA